jgi:hypothetical protein
MHPDGNVPLEHLMIAAAVAWAVWAIVELRVRSKAKRGLEQSAASSKEITGCELYLCQWSQGRYSKLDEDGKLQLYGYEYCQRCGRIRAE